MTDIDRIVHEPARLKILGHLYVVETADFLFLMRQTGLTQGNLSSHMTKLEEAGYIAVQKEFAGKRPRTLLKMTATGRKAFEGYVRQMQEVLAEVAPTRPKARPRRLVLTALKACLAVVLIGNVDGATTEVRFDSYDGHPMLGKLTLPDAPGPHPVILYVQTAEGQTVDMKRPLGGGRTFNYYDVYRDHLPPLGVGFFSYQGRGIAMGDAPPRYEAIDRAVYDTSTLDNKVQDALSALAAIRNREGVDRRRIFVMGASEGTLLAAETAARAPDEIRGAILYSTISTSLKEAMHFMSGEGAFMQIAQVFDTDKNGTVSPQEYENEPVRRRTGLAGTAFGVLDVDSDGAFEMEDFVKLRGPIIDAIDKGDFPVIYAWLRPTAGVSIPANWVEDHYAHAGIRTFLAKITGPVAVFHAAGDPLTPIAGARDLEAWAKANGKTNMEFRYFEGLDHSLGIGAYFTGGPLPAGHKAIFDYIRTHVAE